MKDEERAELIVRMSLPFRWDLGCARDCGWYFCTHAHAVPAVFPEVAVQAPQPHFTISNALTFLRYRAEVRASLNGRLWERTMEVVRSRSTFAAK